MMKYLAVSRSICFGIRQQSFFSSSGMTGMVNMYDAYVIHADEDFPFVIELITQLEGYIGLRLCIANRDLLAGSTKFMATAALIRKRYVNELVFSFLNFTHRRGKNGLIKYLYRTCNKHCVN